MPHLPNLLELCLSYNPPPRSLLLPKATKESPQRTPLPRFQPLKRIFLRAVRRRRAERDSCVDEDKGGAPAVVFVARVDVFGVWCFF
jgi:hypothetical protein